MTVTVNIDHRRAQTDTRGANQVLVRRQIAPQESAATREELEARGMIVCDLRTPAPADSPCAE